MENANNKKGSFMGLLPLVIFLVVYFAMGIGTGDFGNFPLMIGIFLASGISLFMKSPVAEKKTFTEKMVMFCKGGGDDTLILMVIIYMLAGAFYGVASGMHATDTVTNIGISILPTNMILPGLFLIGCVLSFSMGTSMGTVAALMPIGIDIASKTGVSLALVSGIVVGGAMFGDNLSFISDTTIAALVSLVDVATTNNTISIIAVGPIAKDISEEFDIAPARTASILDLFSSAFNGLTPYAGQLLTAGAMAKIAPVTIMPYVWYDILMIIFGVIFIVIGWPKFKGKAAKAN